MTTTHKFPLLNKEQVNRLAWLLNTAYWKRNKLAWLLEHGVLNKKQDEQIAWLLNMAAEQDIIR